MTEKNLNIPPATAQASEEKQKLKSAFEHALRMAVRQFGATWPNPPVGCAILDKEGNLLSLAAHCRAGEPHAEILALEMLKSWGLAERAACMIITLEPCNHHGKTPPCVEALLKSNIPEIWIGAPDPNKTASGGAEALERAGRKVFRLWEMEDPAFKNLMEECQALITPFKTRLSANRPWLILKQALDEEGEMIPPKGQKTFTTQAALEMAHLLRRSCGGIITGRGTVLADQPLFTVRHISDFERSPERWIIVCGQQELPQAWVESRLKAGFQFFHAPSPQAAISRLAKAGVDMALIEAGPTLLNAFRKAGLVDEFIRIHKDGELDRLEWQKISNAPSPLALLEKYSADWPRHLPLLNQKSLAISPEIFKHAFTRQTKKGALFYLKKFFFKGGRKK